MAVVDDDVADLGRASRAGAGQPLPGSILGLLAGEPADDAVAADPGAAELTLEPERQLF